MTLRLSEVEKIRCKNGRTLVDWLSQYKYFAKKRVHVVKNEEDRFVIRLYTSDHCYQIVAKGDRVWAANIPVLKGEHPAYLGCTASTRRPRPGEDWTRGNDLPDGRFNLQTLQSIIGAIVFYEAKEVIKPRKRVPDTEEELEPIGPSLQ